MKLCHLFSMVIAINCLVSAQDVNDEVVFKKIGSYKPPGAQCKKQFWVPRHFEASWMLVRPICKAYGFDIATFDTREEMDAVRNMCEQNPEMFGYSTHVGGMASVPKSKTDWYWVTNNQKIAYTMPWQNGQPENYRGSSWCLNLLTNGGFQLGDMDCNSVRGAKFICHNYECDQ